MAPVKKYCLKNGRAGITIVAAMAFLFCSKDYNPFTDLTNAKVHVTYWSFKEGDTVAIYETGIFKAVVALREEVDSFKFHAPKNRFWQDTTVRTPPDGIIDGGPYLFRVSFFDTGRDSVTVTTFRSNHEAISQDFSVLVRSPLLQKSVRGYFGETLYLNTPKVPDTVLYHWKMGDNWHISSVSDSNPVSLPLINPPSGQGWVSVTDLAGKNESPAVSFTYTLGDTSKPIIRCVNSGLQDKTIISGDTTFSFEVRITDAGNEEVRNCSVNQEAFDFSDRASHIYGKIFNNLPELTKNNTPITVIVYARDNEVFKNVSTETFFVVFKQGAATSAQVSVDFINPSTDTTTSSEHTTQIYGNARSNHGDTMTVLASVNGTGILPAKVINGQGPWNWFVPLDKSTNTVVVTAYSRDNRFLASSQRVIKYNPAAIDSLNPIIWEISAEGVLIGSQFFYTEKSEVPIRVIAFDGPSGVAKMIINQDPLKVTDTTFIWNWTAKDVTHGGLKVSILVEDKQGNQNTREFTIYKNVTPTLLTRNISIPERCCMDSTYRDTLSWTDFEHDFTDFKVINPPEGMTFETETDLMKSVISWKPPVRPDSARDSLCIELHDSYGFTPYKWPLTSFPCNQPSAAIAFTSSGRDFPKVLQVGLDQLHVALSINAAGLSFTPRYSARFLDNGNSILENDTTGILKWLPSTQDTGFRNLMVTVGNGEKTFDTIFAAFWVVPMNQYPCSISARFSGTFTPAGALDLFTHPAPETLFFTIHDQDDPLTETYNVTVNLGTFRTAEAINQKEFFVAISPKASKPTDTLCVSVSDRTRSTDSLRFIVQYTPATGNSPPEVLEGPNFPKYFWADSNYTGKITLFDLNNDNIEVVIVHAPFGMSVFNTGDVLWKPLKSQAGKDSLVIRLFDQKDSSAPSSWPTTVVDYAKKPPAVLFQTKTDEFPKWVQAGADSISIQLKIASNTGVLPFKFSASSDNGSPIQIDTNGKTLWKPTNPDTGIRTLKFLVRDYYETGDSLLPQITVVPRNSQPCKLSYIYSGTTLPSGFLYMPTSEFASTPPESALFTIHDDDSPLTEQYTVKIVPRSAASSSLSLPGASRAFSVKINTSYTSSTKSKDTIKVSVKDKTGTSDSVNLVVQYPIQSPSDVPQLTLSLTSDDGVNTTRGDQVTSWSDGSGYYHNPNSITQGEYSRQPTLVQSVINGNSAIYFDHQNDNGDDGLLNSSYIQWADTPFTLFVVFSANSVPANARQTLVSTNTSGGFGVGIACNGKLGIFNDASANSCPAQDSASTNLTIVAKTWYVATFQSSLGITVGGDIRVQAWLNGTAASQQMEMRTQSNSGLSVGTGGSDYGGSFDGYIAAFAIYQRALSNDERSLVERYLGSYYKITIR
jgi:hypothetical protein